MQRLCQSLVCLSCVAELRVLGRLYGFLIRDMVGSRNLWPYLVFWRKFERFGVWYFKKVLYFFWPKIKNDLFDIIWSCLKLQVFLVSVISYIILYIVKFIWKIFLKDTTNYFLCFKNYFAIVEYLVKSHFYKTITYSKCYSLYIYFF